MESQALERETAETYTPEKGQHIAESYAAGEPLRDICAADDGWLPSMMVVRRWRVLFPAFDALMVEAAACRAENMVEDILEISDDTSQQAAHNRNRMGAREKAAGWLAPAAYGGVKDTGKGEQDAPLYALTDEQLLAIAAGKLAPALEGECERLPAEGVAPPVRSRPGTQYEVSGLPQPASISGEHSVTTTGKDSVKGVIDYSGCEIGGDGFLVDEPEIRVEKEGRRSFVGMDEG